MAKPATASCLNTNIRSAEGRSGLVDTAVPSVSAIFGCAHFDFHAQRFIEGRTRSCWLGIEAAGDALDSLLIALRVAETSSGNEVVDSAGFVPKLISHVDDSLGALALD